MKQIQLIIQMIYSFIFQFAFHLKEQKTLRETNMAPENRPGPKRKGSSSNHPFLGANC